LNTLNRLFVTAALLCGSAISLNAQTDIPDFVLKGLAVYEKSGSKEAMAIWLKGSAIENDVSARVALSGLEQIEAALGKMIGFEPIRVVSFTPSIIRIYAVLKFQKGPLYFSLDCYRADKEWTMANVDFHTKAANILPAEILARGK
jgi:hypothetical protein